MSDEHIREAMLKEGYVKTFEQRTRRKQSIRTNTHKLLNKAQANIEAVEKGTFGVGHAALNRAAASGPHHQT